MNSIVSVLAATRSPSKEGRALAEQQLASFCETDPASLVNALLECAESSETEIADKQSALYILKTLVTRKWSAQSDQFAAPEFNNEIKAEVKQRLLLLLTTTTSTRVRTASASAIQRISSFDYPQHWPSLVSDSLQLLDNPIGSVQQIGGLVLFIELVRETFSEEDFEKVSVQLLSTLLTMVSFEIGSDVSAVIEQRNLALIAFKESTTFFLMVDAASTNSGTEVQELAEQSIPQFVAQFNTMITDVQHIQTILEVVSTLKELDSGFQEILEPTLPTMYETVISTLSKNYFFIEDNEDLMGAFCYLLELCLQNSEVRKQCLSTTEAISTLAPVLVRLAAVSEDDIGSWNDDFNEYVTSEMELDVDETSPRSYAGVMVAGTGNPAILGCLLGMDFTETKFKESVLFLVSSLVTQVDVKTYFSSLDPLLFQKLLGSLEFALVSEGDEYANLLYARQIVVAAYAAKYFFFLPADIRVKLASHAFNVVNSANQLVIAAQLKSMNLCASIFPDIYTPSHERGFFQLVIELLEPSNEDTPLFLTECLRTLLKMPQIGTSVANTDVLDLLFQLAMKNTADNDLISEVIDIVGDFLDVYNSNESTVYILSRVIAVIDLSEQTQFAYSSDLCFALELATAVFKHEDVDLTGFDQEGMLNRFFDVIKTTQDPQVFQVATFTHLSLYKDIKYTVSQATSENVVQIAKLLLQPSLDESLAVACGEYFVNVIDVLGSSLWETLLPMIKEAAQRLATAKNALLVEALVLLFSELAVRNAEAVVSILSESQLLEPVMKQWVPAFEVIRGADEIEKNILALETLVDLHNPVFDAILVNDEPIRNGKRIMTRRQAQNLQFTQVVLPVKIVKMFIKELSQTPQLNGDFESQKKAVKTAVANDDDEWDDELAFDDEGEVVNYKTFGLIVKWLEKLYASGNMEWLSHLTSQERKVLMEAYKVNSNLPLV